VATYCAELARSLHSLGHPIEVWAPDYRRLSPQDPEIFPVVRLPGPGNLRPSGLFHLAKALWQRRKNLEGSLLLLPSVGAQMAVMLLSLLPGWPPVKIALLWHGSEILRFGHNPFWKNLAARLISQASFYFAASPFAGTLAEKGFSSSLQGSVRVIPCAPSSDAFLPPEPLPPDSLGRIRILTLARLHPRKGQLHTLRALAGLSPELKARMIYQIAGEGDVSYLNELRQGCQTAGIAFEYLGPVPPSRLSSIYAQCDIYAMTSRSLPRSVEGFGITYLEAGLQSKPVVACRTGGVDGAVLDGETGLLVGEDDLSGLTSAFASLVSDASLLRRLGEGNFRHASGFSWNHSARLLLDQLVSLP
jgi:glycosyltransferase involved in cell wall biosynthesis